MNRQRMSWRLTQTSRRAWYHVVMEGDDGQPVHTYLAEAQLSSELQDEHPEQPTMDELAQTIRKQLQAPRLRN